MLSLRQVDLSIISPNMTEGLLTLEFLSGEKRQAVRTHTLVPPSKRVFEINGECNHIQLQNYLYVPSYLHKTTKPHTFQVQLFH